MGRHYKGMKDPKYRIAQLEREIEARKASLAKLRDEVDEAEESEDEVETVRDDATNRVVVKFFWNQLGKPTDPETWHGKGGVISLIRRRMGAGAPSVHACKRTLERLAEDENDDVSRRLETYSVRSISPSRSLSWRCHDLRHTACRTRNTQRIRTH